MYGLGNVEKEKKTRGGIGLCVSREISVPGDNLHGSRGDSFKRLLSLVRIKNTKTAIGVAYIPNDGVEKEITDALYYELFENFRTLTVWDSISFLWAILAENVPIIKFILQ